MVQHTRISFLAFSVLCLGMAITEAASDRFLEFPDAAPGQIYKVRKVLDTATGRMKLESVAGPSLNMEGLRSLEVQQHNALRGKNGNLTPSLSEKIPRMGNGDKKRVAVHLKMKSGVYLDKTQHSQAELTANSLAWKQLGPVTSLETVMLRNGLTPVGNNGLAIVICEAGRTQLESLKNDSDVAAVTEVREEENLGPELATLAASAYNPGPVPSGAGSGINAATFEWGLTQSYLTCIGISPAGWDAFTGTADDLKRHTQATFRCLTSAAPSATFYHRKSTTYNGTNDVNYLIDNNIQITSMARTRGGTSPYRSTYSEFLTMDDFSYRNPYPVFITPTANAGYAYEVNWQNYNAISVGNVRHTNNSTFEMGDCTQTKNPPPVYGGCISGSGADCAGDREMPYVVVPGIPSSGTTFATTCLEGAGSVTCGTSMSCSILNGIAADVMAADSRLVGWPEKIRATLMLTAQNVESGDWADDGDERDGTGTVSGYEAVAFAQAHTWVGAGNTAVEKGMTGSSYYAADFSGNKRFNIAVPNPKPSGKHLRVVLTWDSNPVISSGINALSDLDLVVEINGGTKVSNSWDSNIEVVDVANSEVTAGTNYYADIVPYANRIPSGASANLFYYSIAWSWVKDHAP